MEHEKISQEFSMNEMSCYNEESPKYVFTLYKGVIYLTDEHCIFSCSMSNQTKYTGKLIKVDKIHVPVFEKRLSIF